MKNFKVLEHKCLICSDLNKILQMHLKLYAFQHLILCSQRLLGELNEDISYKMINKCTYMYIFVVG